MCTINNRKSLEELLSDKEEFKYWEVSEKGDIFAKEAYGVMVEIYAQELTRTNWLTHFFKKCYPEDGEQIKEEFYFAYFQALRRAKINAIVMDTNEIDVKSFK